MAILPCYSSLLRLSLRLCGFAVGDSSSLLRRGAEVVRLLLEEVAALVGPGDAPRQHQLAAQAPLQVHREAVSPRRQVVAQREVERLPRIDALVPRPQDRLRVALRPDVEQVRRQLLAAGQVLAVGLAALADEGAHRHRVPGFDLSARCRSLRFRRWRSRPTAWPRSRPFSCSGEPPSGRPSGDPLPRPAWKRRRYSSSASPSAWARSSCSVWARPSPSAAGTEAAKNLSTCLAKCTGTR